MTAFSHKETHLALRGILLGVAGIPTARAFENVAFTPTPGTPYLDETYAPSTNALLTVTRGQRMLTGLYVVTWYGLAGAGISAIRDGVDALLTAFAAGSSFAMPSGLVLRIDGSIGPNAGQILPLDTGFACSIVTIKWWVNAPA